MEEREDSEECEVGEEKYEDGEERKDGEEECEGGEEREDGMARTVRTVRTAWRGRRGRRGEDGEEECEDSVKRDGSVEEYHALLLLSSHAKDQSPPRGGVRTYTPGTQPHLGYQRAELVLHWAFDATGACVLWHRAGLGLVPLRAAGPAFRTMNRPKPDSRLSRRLTLPSLESMPGSRSDFQCIRRLKAKLSRRSSREHKSGQLSMPGNEAAFNGSDGSKPDYAGSSSR